MEAPIAGAMQRAVNSVQQGGTWKTGLFGCCDAGLCLKATCAPCLLAGENAERLEPGSYTSTCCKMSTCYMLTGSDAYVAWKQRQRLRETYSLEKGGGCGDRDWLAAWCCYPFVLVQHKRELDARIPRGSGGVASATGSGQQGGTWKTGLFGCCDAGLCLKATCAPCLLAGENAERLEPGSYTSTCCKMSTCYMLTGSDAYVAWKQRQRLRETYSLEKGGGCGDRDWLAAWCCYPFVLVQHKRELDARSPRGSGGGARGGGTDGGTRHVNFSSGGGDCGGIEMGECANPVAMAAGALGAVASELPIIGLIARVAFKLKNVYDVKQHADKGCVAMAKWATDIESVITQLPTDALSNAAIAILTQLLQLLERMLAVAEARAAQSTIAQFARSAECAAQQRAVQGELARLLPLLQLGVAAAALRQQVETMDAVLRSETKLDELSVAASEILNQARQRSEAEQRQSTRDRAMSAYSVSPSDVELQLDAVLGRGGSATVYKAYFLGEVVAAKVADLSALTVKERYVLMSELQHELALMARLPPNPHIVQVRGMCEDSAANRLIMLMQLAAGGSVRQMLDGSTVPLDTAHAVALLKDAATGMAFLHAKKVLHRDVKSLNLLLDEKGHVLVSDFGISKQSNNATATMGGGSGMKGSAPWMAPESIRRQPFTQACDVYAFGIVVWEILSRQTPWQGCDHMQIGFAVANEGARPPLEAVQGKLYPASLIALMQECWAQDPAARPSFAEIGRRLDTL